MRFLKLGAVSLLVAFGVMAAAQVPDVAPLSPKREATTATKALITPTTGHALDAADIDSWLDGFMPFALHSNDIAGAVVMVVKDGQVMTARGYGYADIAKKTPVDPARTLFRPGSVSKLVTWTAVMQQVEAGKLNLDADVNAYLDFKIPPRNGQPVTLRQIMTHTAGFEETVKDLISFDQVPPLERYLKRWTPHRIFDAGTTPAYSNWATALAAYMVQRVSGLPFDDYVEQRIFKPLDMKTASFRQPLPANLRPLAAIGYPRASQPAQGYENVGPAPAGSLAASGEDMAKFMIANLSGNGGGLMSAQTMATMLNSPTAKVNPRSLIPPLNRMELGFFETNINGHEVVGHLGDTENFHTSLHLFTDDGVGIYFSFNSAGKEGGAHLVRGQLFQNFADRYFPQTVPDGRMDPKVSAEHAKLLAGNWQVSRRSDSNFVNILNLFGQTTVAVGDKGELVIPALTAANGAPTNWVEIAPFVWRDTIGHDRLAAQVVDGKPVRWSFDLGSPFMVFDRVPLRLSSAWLLPALYASLAVVLLTFLWWPAAWFIRRQFKQAIPIGGASLKAYRAVRTMAGLDLLVLGGWAFLITQAFAKLSLLSAGLDPWLWLLQIGGAIVFVGAVAIAAWNVSLTWRDGRRWPAKLWSVLILLATAIVLYVAWSYSLLAMTDQF